MNKIPFVDLLSQYRSIKEEIDEAIASVIQESSFVRGPHVEEFEESYRRKMGMNHCISCANGTDALYISMKVINDEFKEGRPATGDQSKWRVTNIGNHVSIGTNATILPVTICDHVVVGAGSVVTKDIHVPGLYAGNPAKLIRKYK